jgi:hypothetical protein
VGNKLLFLLGIVALSNGNINIGNLLNNNKGKNKPALVKTKKNKTNIKKHKNRSSDKNNTFNFNMSDINKGMKLLDLSEEDLDRGLEVISRSKKYVTPDEQVFLIKVESMLDLVRGIKRLNGVDFSNDINESDFFRSMDEEDKKNMMIKEIIEVFPENKKESIEKAMDMKNKIELFAELFLPDDIGENGEGFNLGSILNLNNLGSLGNLELLSGLFRSEKDEEEDDEDTFEDEDYEEIDEDEEYDEEEEFDVEDED